MLPGHDCVSNMGQSSFDIHRGKTYSLVSVFHNLLCSKLHDERAGGRYPFWSKKRENHTLAWSSPLGYDVRFRWRNTSFGSEKISR